MPVVIGQLDPSSGNITVYAKDYNVTKVRNMGDLHGTAIQEIKQKAAQDHVYDNGGFGNINYGNENDLLNLAAFVAKKPKHHKRKSAVVALLI